MYTYIYIHIHEHVHIYGRTYILTLSYNLQHVAVICVCSLSYLSSMMAASTQEAEVAQTTVQVAATVTPPAIRPLLIPSSDYRMLSTESKEQPLKFPASCPEPKQLGTGRK